MKHKIEVEKTNSGLPVIFVGGGDGVGTYVLTKAGEVKPAVFVKRVKTVTDKDQALVIINKDDVIVKVKRKDSKTFIMSKSLYTGEFKTKNRYNMGENPYVATVISEKDKEVNISEIPEKVLKGVNQQKNKDGRFFIGERKTKSVARPLAK